MKNALIGSAYLISGSIFIGSATDQFMAMLGMGLGLTGIIITLFELFRKEYK